MHLVPSLRDRSTGAHVLRQGERIVDPPASVAVLDGGDSYALDARLGLERRADFRECQAFSCVRYAEDAAVSQSLRGEAGGECGEGGSREIDRRLPCIRAHVDILSRLEGEAV